MPGPRGLSNARVIRRRLDGKGVPWIRVRQPFGRGVTSSKLKENRHAEAKCSRRAPQNRFAVGKLGIILKQWI